MQDIYIETEKATQPLRFAMAASRVVSVLQTVQNGDPIDAHGKRSLEVASDLLDCAAQGGSILRDRSMKGYSANALSAFHLVQETHAETQKKDFGAAVRWLKGISTGLRALAKNPKARLPLPIDELQQFFRNLAQRSLEGSAHPREQVRLG